MASLGICGKGDGGDPGKALVLTVLSNVNLKMQKQIPGLLLAQRSATTSSPGMR